jgi:hypothetical protein
VALAVVEGQAEAFVALMFGNGEDGAGVEAAAEQTDGPAVGVWKQLPV